MEGLSRSHWREAPPNHLRFRIESFSTLSASWSNKRFESSIFSAGDYTWKLAFYPNGNTEKDGEDHLSLYLVLALDSHHKVNKLQKGILVSFTFLLFDHIRERYFSVQEVRRFDAKKSESGFDKFMPLKSFINPENGYLADDTCVFGADIFIIENDTPNEQCLSMMTSKPARYKHTWKVEKFSGLEDKEYFSEKFTTRGHDWRISLIPKGNGIFAKGNSLSLYLELADPATPRPEGKKVLVEFKLRVVDQVNKNHKERTGTHCLSASIPFLGYDPFLPLSALYKPGEGYLVDDTCIIEAEVIVLGSAKCLG